MQDRGKTHERVWARLFEIVEVMDRNVLYFDKTESRQSDHAYDIIMFWCSLARAEGAYTHGQVE